MDSCHYCALQPPNLTIGNFGGTDTGFDVAQTALNNYSRVIFFLLEISPEKTVFEKELTFVISNKSLNKKTSR